MTDRQDHQQQQEQARLVAEAQALPGVREVVDVMQRVQDVQGIRIAPTTTISAYATGGNVQR